MIRDLGLSEWRRDTLRTNLWLVPAIEVALAAALFAGTYALDRAAYRGELTVPSWVISGTPDAARQILTTLAAAVITVVGVVFSIMIVTLTLASTQFGPRMLRNFIRDRGAQLTLGTFVATFVYAILALVSIGPGSHGEFVPHISITVALGLVVVDLAVLIYFIHHIATTIQLPQVIASIARDLSKAIDVETGASTPNAQVADYGPSVPELLRRMTESGGVVPTPRSGYLQFVRYDTLVRIASLTGSVVRLRYRPGHFVVRGHPLAVVWPPAAAPDVARELRRAHITGPNRTLTQDLAFAVDQLVEIAIRALSPAVNDTFTAITCIDWLGDSLCQVAARWNPTRVHRDREGYVRVITAPVSYRRLVERAFEKIRQAGRGMPAIMIRQLEALAKIMEYTSTPDQRQVLLEQAAMIERANVESVPEESDRADVRRRYDALLAVEARLAQDTLQRGTPGGVVDLVEGRAAHRP
ncbi:MAG TPA: DUF2254 domain-containing protein [Solirubrobacteraceae bacterium]|jgi:uncharacterized membrane protein|nr:DUF2254 domain-containing protein [Solirubrobacteraceae bacterium]